MLKVFSADESDLDWMFRLFIHAANKGHFVLDNNQDGRARVKRNISSIITHQLITDYNRRAQAMIFENELGKVGYAVMSEIKAGRGGNEIHLFVVDREMRGKGYGRFMLDEIIRRWHPAADIFARVFPSSKQMASLLRNTNFSIEGKNREGADIYKLPKLT
jgi:GNAT superfamily N-acetyltransferase